MASPENSEVPDRRGDGAVDSRSVYLRSALGEDVNAIVKLHIAAFQGFFLTRLGERFLRELYRGFVEEVGGVCLIAAGRGGEILGVAAGAIAPGRFFRGLLLHRGWRFVVASIPALIGEPSYFAVRLGGALLYRGDKPRELEGAALLSSLAVHPSVSGRGIGMRLIEGFAARASSAGAIAIYLTTDASENEGVNEFYAKMGFAVFDRIVRRHGRVLNVYCRPADCRAEKSASRSVS